MPYIKDHRSRFSVHLCLISALAFFSLLLFIFSDSPPTSAHVQNQRAAVVSRPRPTPSPKTQQQQPDEVDDGEVISVTTSEVLLPVTVHDREGKLVTNLTKNNFRIYEDGAEQPLSDLALREVPVDVVLMVDASSSAADNGSFRVTRLDHLYNGSIGKRRRFL